MLPLKRGQTLNTGRRLIRRLIIQADIESRHEIIQDLVVIVITRSRFRTTTSSLRWLTNRWRWRGNTHIGVVEIGTVLVIAVRTYKLAVLEVVELGSDWFFARTDALEAIVVVEQLIGDLLVRLAGAERQAAFSALGRVLFVTVLAHQRACFLLYELFAAQRTRAFRAAQALRMVVLVLVGRYWRRRCYLSITFDAFMHSPLSYYYLIF